MDLAPRSRGKHVTQVGEHGLDSSGPSATQAASNRSVISGLAPSTLAISPSVAAPSQIRVNNSSSIPAQSTLACWKARLISFMRLTQIPPGLFSIAPRASGHGTVPEQPVSLEPGLVKVKVSRGARRTISCEVQEPIASRNATKIDGKSQYSDTKISRSMLRRRARVRTLRLRTTICSPMRMFSATSRSRAPAGPA
jgi:hypothetical protein